MSDSSDPTVEATSRPRRGFDDEAAALLFGFGLLIAVFVVPAVLYWWDQNTLDPAETRAVEIVNNDHNTGVIDFTADEAMEASHARDLIASWENTTGKTLEATGQYRPRLSPDRAQTVAQCLKARDRCWTLADRWETAVVSALVEFDMLINSVDDTSAPAVVMENRTGNS